MLEDTTVELEKEVEKNNFNCKLCFPDNITYYFFEWDIGFFDNDGVGYYIPRRQDGTYESHSLTYEDLINECEEEIPYRQTILNLLKNNVVYEAYYEDQKTYIVKSEEISSADNIKDVYFLELGIIDPKGHFDHYYYFVNAAYKKQVYPLCISFMNLKCAKETRIKLFNEHQNGKWEGLKEIKIKKATIQFKEEIEIMECL